METLVVNDSRIRTVEFPRFGACSFTDDEILSFPWGIPGFPELHTFVALQTHEQERFIWLQSLDDPKVAFPIADPWAIFEEYEPVLPAYAKVALDLRSPEDFAIYCVVVVTGAAREMTMNLLAPIVVNLRTRTGRQVTLESQTYAVRTAIPRRTAGEALI